MTKKSLWRCNVCNDVHYGIKPPQICPTCKSMNAFVRIDHEEAWKIVGETGEDMTSEEKVINAWKEFADQSTTFRLTSNEEEIGMLSKGVLENLRNKGLKYCPCRVPSGNFDSDMNLICPCNFLRQRNWTELGECWCGLFVKRE